MQIVKPGSLRERPVASTTVAQDQPENTLVDSRILANGQRRAFAARQQGQRLGLSLINGQAVLGAQLIHLAMLDEMVGQPMRTTGTVLPNSARASITGRAEAAHLHVVLKGHKGGHAPAYSASISRSSGFTNLGLITAAE